MKLYLPSLAELAFRRRQWLRDRLRSRLHPSKEERMLPIGQQLWLRHLESYLKFPPLQDPASYNLEQVMQQVRNMKTSGRGD